MKSGTSPRISRLWGGALGGLLLACGGHEPVGPVHLPPPAPPPCGLTPSTPLVDDKKFIGKLSLFTPPADPGPDELEADCRAVWQEAVEDRHCGRVLVPAFCDTCSDAAEKVRCLEGNGRGHVMQHCRVASLAAFAANYPSCKDFVLCAGKLQHKTVKCEAGRQ